ncbi:MAG: hypothetical protein JXB88_13875 [Spirochaetales bacterium]|nr:hypothetical protein [Spirochaetales bacterium]
MKRDMLAASFAYTNRIPLVMVLSGGYSGEYTVCTLYGNKGNHFPLLP